MKIGIITDSHDDREKVLKAVEIFRKEEVNYVLHAGDIVAPSTAEIFSELEGAKFIAVFGNCDREKVLLANCISHFGGYIHDNIYIGEIGGRRIFMTHKPSELDEVADSDRYDLVVYGHTHKKFIHRVDGSLVVNPGESAVVIVELDDMSVKEHPLVV